MPRKLTDSHLESVMRRVKELAKKSGNTGQQQDVDLLVGHLDALKEENKQVRERGEKKAMAQLAEVCLTTLGMEVPQKVKDILAGK